MDYLLNIHIGVIPRAILLVVLGYFISRLLSMSINKALKNRLRPHQTMLIRRITFYLVLALFVVSAIQQLGFQISTLLGATGILTVGLGIASQTSMSNVISGIFIIGEKPFEIGDTVKINDVQGEVLSIDFLSVKIRTNNNTMIRIPNETLIKSAITNFSFFPLRRVDVTIGIAYKEDLKKVKALFLETTTHISLCLDSPKPSLLIQSFGDSAINIRFSVWGKKEDHDKLQNAFF